MSRTILSLTLISLILGVWVPPEPAAAGTIQSLISPGDCASPFVAGAMQPPNTFTAAEDKACKALCKRAAAQCKQYAKGALACALGAAKLERRYALQNCKLISATPAALKECFASANDAYKGIKLDNAALAPQVLADCAGWGDDCQTACAGKPL
jgi:hypothetical protein